MWILFFPLVHTVFVYVYQAKKSVIQLETISEKTNVNFTIQISARGNNVQLKFCLTGRMCGATLFLCISIVCLLMGIFKAFSFSGSVVFHRGIRWTSDACVAASLFIISTLTVYQWKENNYQKKMKMKAKRKTKNTLLCSC